MRCYILWFSILLCAGSVHAQTPGNKLALTLPDAETMFLQKNLALLAQQYNISINKALVQQARNWNNPVLSTDQTLYDGKFFRHGTVDGQSYGQIYFQLQQLILTAGKRNKQIQLAKDGVLTAEQQFNDLLRNLRFVLTTDFNTLYQLNSVNAVYDHEITSMQQLARGMEAQFKAGNISEKDNIRIKSLLYSLQSEQADLQRQLADAQKELRVMLQLQEDTLIVPVVQHAVTETTLNIPRLLDSARTNRPDLQLSKNNVLLQEHQLAYQKALAVPDITTGIEYDHINSYVKNYWGLTIDLPLPLLNRNKGNIEAARLAVQQAGTAVQQVQSQVEQDVIAAYQKYLTAQSLQKNMDPALNEPYDRLLDNMVTSYQQRQINLIEFIDFFESYKETTIKKEQQLAAWRNAAAELNFTTGASVVALQ